MKSDRIARRRPWLAGLFQIFAPGLGNLYGGRPLRGLILHFCVLCILFAGILAVVWLPPPVNLLFCAGSILAATILSILDGVRCARASDPRYRLAGYNRWYVYLVLLVGLAFIDGLWQDFVEARVAAPAQLSTVGMVPTVLPGDHFFTNKMAYVFSDPKRGDLVFYETPQMPDAKLLQRIVGLPGETIEIRNRAVFINGQRIDEPYARFLRPSSEEPTPGDSLVPYVIPGDGYFVLGDNRDNSLDSRFLGAFNRRELRGMVGTVYFSWDSELGRVRWDRIGKALK
jgi:signal peptidase I